MYQKGTRTTNKTNLRLRLLVEPASTNLSLFSANGGKLLFFYGDSDPWFSPLDTLEYYKSLAERNGGADKVANARRRKARLSFTT
jgi:feruloyl esterase